LFAGVLDGGEKDVMLGGTKLNKFMETVEQVTSAIPEATVEEADAAYGAPEAPEPQAARPAPKGKAGRRPVPAPPVVPAAEEMPEPAPALAASDAWGGLLQAGMALLQRLVTPAPNGQANGQPTRPSGGSASFVQRDEKTGESFLKVPLP